MSPRLLYVRRVPRHFSPRPHILSGFVVAAKNVTVTHRQNNLRAGLYRLRPVGKTCRSWTGDGDQRESETGATVSLNQEPGVRWDRWEQQPLLSSQRQML